MKADEERRVTLHPVRLAARACQRVAVEQGVRYLDPLPFRSQGSVHRLPDRPEDVALGDLLVVSAHGIILCQLRGNLHCRSGSRPIVHFHSQSRTVEPIGPCCIW
jgi:hypothetical protein